MKRFGMSVLALGLTSLMAFAPISGVQAQDGSLTADNVVAGTMNITFNTRTTPDTSGDLKSGSPALGAKDVYDVGLTVATTTEFSGKIERYPKLYSSILGRTKQDAKLQYSLDITAVNPKNVAQKKVVGKWVGEVLGDPTSGEYDLAAGKEHESPLRIAIDTVGQMQGYQDMFAGKLRGKAEKKESLSSKTYRRIMGDKEVTITVKKSDPMTFLGIELAKGPQDIYPRCTVNGRLDYDYETSNWLTDGIHFNYNANGAAVEDIVTGSIKWVAEKDYATSGKGYYDFNLRFNEEKNKKPKGEGAAFDAAGEDAFFAVDNTIPCLTGRVEYVDSFVPGTDTVSASKVTYKLNANKLTKQQVMNFVKLWIVCVGPTNDD